MGYFRLDCWWPLKNGLATETVARIVGRPPSDSGAGFGQRDVGWHFQHRDQAEGRAAYQRLKDAGYDCEFNEYDDHHQRRK